VSTLDTLPTILNRYHWFTIRLLSTSHHIPCNLCWFLQNSYWTLDNAQGIFWFYFFKSSAHWLNKDTYTDQSYIFDSFWSNYKLSEYTDYMLTVGRAIKGIFPRNARQHSWSQWPGQQIVYSGQSIWRLLMRGTTNTSLKRITQICITQTRQLVLVSQKNELASLQGTLANEMHNPLQWHN
jgi:hypothetical protein